MFLEKTLVKRFLKLNPVESFGKSFKIVFNNKHKLDEEIKIGEKEPEFSIILNDSIDKKELLKNPSVVLGEAYMDKVIDVKGNFYEALTTIMEIRKQSMSDQSMLKKVFLSDYNLLAKSLFKKKEKDVSKANQKEEVTSHYDIGNNFYKLWLDETMNYSCAYFKNPDDTLYEAQSNKVDYIINKLQLKNGMSLLDVGCGWGDLLIEAAKKYRITGTGITLSEEQHKAFKNKIQKEGLEDSLEVKLMDYRDLKDSDFIFDRIVSVGMIEHVGNKNYDLFLENVKFVLKDKGVFLLHFISGLKEGGSDEWMNKYIFPGGALPSLREIIDKGVNKNFYITDVESLRRHYVKTLLHWYDNFNKAEDAVREMFDERFVRMWRLYLIASAANFNIGGIDLHQVVFTNGVNNDLPMTRENLYNKN